MYSLYSKQTSALVLLILALFAGQAIAQEGPDDDGGGRSGGRGRGGFGRRGGGEGGPRGGGEGGGGGEGRFGGGRGGFGGGGFGGGAPNFTEMFEQLDTNKNGQLEPSERTGRRAEFIDRMARGAGLDPAQPLPIQKLKDAMSSRRGPEGSKPGESPDGKGMPGEPAADTKTPEAKAAEAKAAEEKAAAEKKAKQPTFPGFGVKPTAPAVPGFGEVATAATDKEKPAESRRGRGRGEGRGGDRRGEPRGDDKPSSDPPASEAGGPDGKVRRYAESLLKQYETNKNGTLEKEEWSTMSGQPEKADKNGDGKVSLDELTERLASFGKGGEGGSSGSGSSAGGGPPIRSGSSGKSNRFLTATERLPAGLPSWFTRNDADADGQVVMSEYATTWTTSKVAEFTQYDLNGDGVITPQECLTFEKKGSDKKFGDRKPGEKPSGDKPTGDKPSFGDKPPSDAK